MKYISFVIPSRNNLPFLKQAYNSIRKHLGYVHEVVLLDDFSNDGTWEWMCDIKNKDINSKIYRNDGPDRLGHTILYDKGVELSTNEIFSIFHADMVASPNYVINMVKHLERGKVISSTRIEPPLHPPGPEKIVKNFGMGTDEFKETEFKKFVEKREIENKNKTTKGIFAPWMMYKEDFQNIGGHDPLFAPMELEDSDIFNRMHLRGYDLIQSRDSFVYHMTCRGSRFKDGLEIEEEIPLSDGTIWYKPKDSKEYLDLRAIKIREWLRKWGHMVKHDDLMYPVIPHKYNIGFVVENCSYDILRELEPWCSDIYGDWVGHKGFHVNKYIEEEQPNTNFNLSKKIHTQHTNPTNDIIVRFDCSRLIQQSWSIIQNLSIILADSGKIGIMNLDIFEFEIRNLKTYEKNLVVCES